MIDYSLNTLDIAEDLLGYQLQTKFDDKLTGGIITEVECYLEKDKTNHFYKNNKLYKQFKNSPAGTIYLAKIYGKNLCLNIITKPTLGESILIRSIRPTIGIDTMIQRRGKNNPKTLATGPGNLTQALGISLTSQFHNINEFLIMKRPLNISIKTSNRVGIKEDNLTKLNFKLIDQI